MRSLKTQYIILILSLVLFALSSMVLSYAEGVTKDKGKLFDKQIEIQDIVYKTIKYESGYKVLFRIHAGIYYLKSDVENFNLILNSLKNSRDEEIVINLKVTSTTLNIKAVLSFAKKNSSDESAIYKDASIFKKGINL